MSVLSGKTVWLATGGTGGHVFPALALAEKLRDVGAVPVFCVGGSLPEGVARALEPYQKIRFLSASPAGKSPPALVMAASKLGCGTFQALLKSGGSARPALAAGFGGYASFPALSAAVMRRVPILLHEQNAVMGRVNALFSSAAKRAGLSFERTRYPHGGGGENTRFCGLPVRAAFFEAGRAPYAPSPSGEIRLLVTGGSLGAAAFAALVPPALAALPEALRGRLRVTQQTRAEQIAYVASAYERAGVRAELAPFFDDMPRRLAECDIVLARAGAGTLAEIAAVGRASVLIPFPYAADGHQEANASVLQEAGAAVMLREKGLTPAALAEAVRGYAEDENARAGAALAAKTCGTEDAAGQLFALAEECLA